METSVDKIMKILSDLDNIAIKDGNKTFQQLKNETLCVAASEGNLTNIKILLKIGAFIDNGDEEPLYQACINEHLPAIRLLIEKGAKITYTAKLLRDITKKGYLEVLKYLTEIIGGISDDNIKTMLCFAAINNHCHIVNWIFENFLFNKDAAEAALMQAVVENSHIDVIRLLLYHGTNPLSGADKFNGTSELLDVALNKNLEVFQLLLSYVYFKPQKEALKCYLKKKLRENPQSLQSMDVSKYLDEQKENQEKLISVFNEETKKRRRN